MERKIYICGITNTECPNNKCQYVGTGYGCLHIGSRIVNNEVESYEAERESDREQIYKLSGEQAELRNKLAEVDKDDSEAKKIRGCMMRNRLGNNGLRALNNRLRDNSWKK